MSAAEAAAALEAAGAGGGGGAAKPVETIAERLARIHNENEEQQAASKQRLVDHLAEVAKLDENTRIEISFSGDGDGDDRKVYSLRDLSVLGHNSLVHERIPRGAYGPNGDDDSDDSDDGSDAVDGGFGVAVMLKGITKKQFDEMLARLGDITYDMIKNAEGLDPRRPIEDHGIDPKLLNFLKSLSFAMLEEIVGGEEVNPHTGEAIGPTTDSLGVFLRLTELIELCEFWIQHLCHCGRQAIIDHSGWDLTDMEIVEANVKIMLGYCDEKCKEFGIERGLITDSSAAAAAAAAAAEKPAAIAVAGGGGASKDD